MNIVQGEHKRVVFNLEKVDFVSSAGLRVIIRGAKMLQVHRGELKICNARSGVRSALEMSGFNSLIKFLTLKRKPFLHLALARVKSDLVTPVGATQPHARLMVRSIISFLIELSCFVPRHFRRP